MSNHFEGFRLSTDIEDSLAACRRALLAPGWIERSSDRLKVRLGTMGEGAVFIQLIHIHVPFTRRLIDRLLVVSVRSPAGPPAANAEIHAAYKGSWIVRISLQDRADGGTDVTISGSDLESPWGAPLRSAIRELRRSIEIQSRSIALDLPSDPATPPPLSPAPPAASISTRRWLVAATVGVIVSVAGHVAIANLLPSVDPLSMVGGLLVGSGAAGVIVGARSPKDWAVAGAIVLLSALTLGFLILGSIGLLFAWAERAST